MSSLKAVNAGNTDRATRLAFAISAPGCISYVSVSGLLSAGGTPSLLRFHALFSRSMQFHSINTEVSSVYILVYAIT